MNQILQDLQSGTTQLADVPAPRVRPGHLLIATRRSLVSAGTERMLVEFGQAGLLGKAKAQPDKVRQVLDKARTDGPLATLDAVRNRLAQPLPLGYCNAGVVIEVGAGVQGFSPGDRVASNGPHAGVVCMPRNLCARIPDAVQDDAAAFTVLASVGLQGIRLAAPTLGESVAVIGLGLVGLLTVQMLVANGCRVIGCDYDASRVALARRFGAEGVDLSAGADPVAAAMAFSGGRGVDAVLITASTRSNDPVHQAAEMSRQRGRIVLVGVTGLALSRADFYEKELTFQVSCSYGPGRYDPAYEEGGHDYPYGLVRWTECRNMEAVLDLMAADRLDVEPLVTHRFPIERAAEAYALLVSGAEPSLGILLSYPDAPDLSRVVPLREAPAPLASAPSEPAVRLGVIGAGLYATSTLLPALRGIDRVERVGIASAGGLSARTAGDRHGFRYCTTESAELLDDPAVNTVAILTRHNRHAAEVLRALGAGKHVVVEKPLCLTADELAEIVGAYRALSADGAPPMLMVGYNRRFAPMVAELKRHLASVQEPLYVHCTANAGYLPADHWTQDPEVGGGRLLGEGCHFIDLALHLVGSPPLCVTTHALPDAGRYHGDNLHITIECQDGSLATVAYLANGDKGFGKEAVEVHGGGLSARIDNYRRLTIRHGRRRVDRTARLRQDKGHRAEWQAIAEHLTAGAPPPIPFDEIVRSTEATLAAHESFRTGDPVQLASGTAPCEDAIP